ncbi:MarR family winged helix-turn-helix transcriptional regulator [Rhodococcus gordoniae]|uniref:MarR family winged helix-turn-helix transcriptional regulator n=1 Tax=Rhodococcus gordoniae TaxID=223392 RepID=UPI0020CFDBD1|nr:MarR family transcriptional regulator [Rhodococcus gordoniae]UTT51026.1 MarR family transcriptional regulator [Rhodococcus gordoniae]
MTSVTTSEIRDREAAVAGVLEAWVRAARAFSGAGVYPVDTGLPGVRLERPAYTMLRELAQRGPRRLGDLALASNLGVSHASRLVEGLVRDGLVERTVPADDRRVTILAATSQGRRAARKIEQEFYGLLTDRLQDFLDQEVLDFATLFQRFADELVEWSEGKIRRA